MKPELHSNLPPIIIDTREQQPYAFDGWKTISKKLDFGDYSLEGYETDCAVERKSFADAYGCVGRSRHRFERHLDGLRRMLRPLIVIESGLAEFATPPRRTRVTAAQAIGSYISWSCTTGIPVVWTGSRAFAERVTLRWLVAFWKHRVSSDAVAC